MERTKWKASVRNKVGAKRLGQTLREWIPDVTWQRVPDRMLKLLMKISEVEARSQGRRQANTTGRHRTGDSSKS